MDQLIIRPEDVESGSRLLVENLTLENLRLHIEKAALMRTVREQETFIGQLQAELADQGEQMAEAEPDH